VDIAVRAKHALVPVDLTATVEDRLTPYENVGPAHERPTLLKAIPSDRSAQVDT